MIALFKNEMLHRSIIKYVPGGPN